MFFQVCALSSFLDSVFHKADQYMYRECTYILSKNFIKFKAVGFSFTFSFRNIIIVHFTFRSVMHSSWFLYKVQGLGPGLFYFTFATFIWMFNCSNIFICLFLAAPMTWRNSQARDQTETLQSPLWVFNSPSPQGTPKKDFQG